MSDPFQVASPESHDDVIYNIVLQLKADLLMLRLMALAHGADVSESLHSSYRVLPELEMSVPVEPECVECFALQQERPVCDVSQTMSVMSGAKQSLTRRRH